MIDIKKLQALEKSPFRRSFHLSPALKQYAQEKGREVLKKHAEDFIKTRLAPAGLPKDGAQTPMKGHPVFIAQHATATCCRGCLQKWYHIPKDRDLTPLEQQQIVELLLAWIEKELNVK